MDYEYTYLTYSYNILHSPEVSINCLLTNNTAAPAIDDEVMFAQMFLVQTDYTCILSDSVKVNSDLQLRRISKQVG